MESKIPNSGHFPQSGVSKEALFSTSQIEVRLVKDEKELDDMFYQRWLVLRSPLGMERGSEKDKYDDSALHLVAVCNNRVKGSDNNFFRRKKILSVPVIGSARLRLLSPELGSIAYVSVLEEFRNQGIGTKLMEKFIEIAGEKKYKTLRLNARIHSLNFYKRLGFVEKGKPSDFLGIPHILMYYHFRA